MNRRTFLKYSAGMAAYAAIGSTGILFPDEAHALGGQQHRWMFSYLI